MLMTFSSMPVISEILITLRVPSLRRETCTTMVIAEAICWRTCVSGRLRLAMATMDSRRDSASRGVLAWMVVIEPSWPVFMACSMSKASSPRTSPMMMRSGRIRRLLISSCRWRTAPWPSTLGGRVSRRTTFSCCKLQFGRIFDGDQRSLSGMYWESMFRKVVLPAPVPPEIRMLMRARTAAASISSISGEMLL